MFGGKLSGPYIVLTMCTQREKNLLRFRCVSGTVIVLYCCGDALFFSNYTRTLVRIKVVRVMVVSSLVRYHGSTGFFPIRRWPYQSLRSAESENTCDWRRLTVSRLRRAPSLGHCASRTTRNPENTTYPIRARSHEQT